MDKIKILWANSPELMKIQGGNPEDYIESAYFWIKELLAASDSIREFNGSFSDLTENYSTHVSVFASDVEHKCYLRVFWPESQKALYFEVKNFEKNRKETPELFKLLQRNGVYAYLRSNDPEECQRVFHTN